MSDRIKVIKQKGEQTHELLRWRLCDEYEAYDQCDESNDKGKRECENSDERVTFFLVQKQNIG